ncbi:unnamed protein product [Meloidogyne enterolobii]|uniref:Uncharacterized protein n=1 Tax=Meloidogyne enterolobii TaxID=390850 RepID=A0ACB0Y1V8_MELEN
MSKRNKFVIILNFLIAFLHSLISLFLFLLFNTLFHFRFLFYKYLFLWTMFDRIIQQLLHSEQFIQKLVDSSPIRRTARFLIRTTFGAKSKILNNKRIERFGQLFREEYQKSIKGK